MNSSGYLSGFGNHFATEAVPGALPPGRNSPQRPAFGLYVEQLSGSAFTMTRSENKRSWLYRVRPTAAHPPFRSLGPMIDPVGRANPNRMRWAPRTPEPARDFVESLTPLMRAEGEGGIQFYTYAADTDMDRKVFFSADGEWLILPVVGDLRIETELGCMTVPPQHLAVVPRGVRFRVRPPASGALGYAIENAGSPFRLPDLGPIGANGLANPRDFLTPCAWFEDRDEPFTLVQKFADQLWQTELDYSPLDVVAWHGNFAPYLYDLRLFNTIGTVSYDHPDPSIFTVLTSPSSVPGQAHADFVIFPPRWMVGEDTFRPPWFHRNLMSEAMGLIAGAYDAKADGFLPGGVSLHNRMNAHGPDLGSWRAATDADLQPHKIEGTMAFMVETYAPYSLTGVGEATAQPDYDRAWSGFPKARLP